MGPDMGLTLLDLTETSKTIEIEALSAEVLGYLAANNIEASEVVIACEVNSEISVQDLKTIALSCGLTDSLVCWRRPLRRSMLRKSPQLADGLLELLGIRMAAQKIVKVIARKPSSKTDFVEVIPTTRSTVLEGALTEIPSLGSSSFGRVELMELSRSISISWPSSRKPRVFVDVSSIIKNDLGTGIQRVIRNLIPEISSSIPDNYEFAVISADENGGPFHYVNVSKGQKSDEITFERTNEIVEFIKSDVFLGLDLNYGVTLSHANYFSTLQRRGVKLVALVYDLLPIQFPRYFPQEVEKLNLHERYLKVLSTFDLAIAISKAVEDDYVEWAEGNSPERFIYQRTGKIPLGSALKKDYSAKTMHGYGKYFLHVGTIEPRKNIQQILDAFEILWSRGSEFNLTLVGKAGWNMDSVIFRIRSHAEFGKKLHWLQNTDDYELSDLYKSAHFLLMASSGEGYGLPILEAHSFGTRVLARDIPVFNEVCGEHDLFFGGFNGEDLAKAIDEIPVQQNKLKFIPTPSWQTSAKGVMKLVFPDN